MNQYVIRELKGEQSIYRSEYIFDGEIYLVTVGFYFITFFIAVVLAQSPSLSPLSLTTLFTSATSFLVSIQHACFKPRSAPRLPNHPIHHHHVVWRWHRRKTLDQPSVFFSPHFLRSLVAI